MADTGGYPELDDLVTQLGEIDPIPDGGVTELRVYTFADGSLTWNVRLWDQVERQGGFLDGGA